MAGIIFLICLGVIVLKCCERINEAQNKLDFLEYTKDTILGYKWKWYWRKDVYGKYCVENLCPVCSKCDTPLVENYLGYHGKYMCLRCGEGYIKSMPDFDNVKMLISDNVRRKYYPDE